MRTKKVLLILLMFFVFVKAQETDDKWKDVKATIEQMERDTQTDKKIKENIKQMNSLIKDALTVINGKKPKVLFKVSDDKYLMMSVDSQGTPVSKIVPKVEVKGQMEVPNQGINVKVKPSLPTFFFVLSTLIYIFATGYFLFMAGYNIRYGNYFSSLLDLLIWVISSGIMWEILQAMR